jgi:hypothetical protein
VIHLAFNVDMARSGDFQGAVDADRRAVEALGEALTGSDRPLVIASATVVLAPGRVGTEQDAPGLDPVRAENLCHQAIFVDHATSSVTPPDPELVRAGDAVGQQAQRRGLLQGPVRPVRAAEILLLPQHDHQVPLVPGQRPVRQLPSAAANPAFHDRVHPRRLDRGPDDPGAPGPENGVERGGEAGVPVMEHQLHPVPCQNSFMGADLVFRVR